MKAIILSVVVFTTACVKEKEPELKSKPVKPDSIRLIALTDFHGTLLPKTKNFSFQGKNYDFASGGAAELSSHLDFIRKQSGYPSFVIDAGDLFQGSFVSNSAEGLPVVDVYNAIGVDAAAVGNHEFDFGPAGEKSVPETTEDNPTGALEAAADAANFPFLSANIINRKTKKAPGWLRPSVMLEKQGVKIGVVGASTPSTPLTTNQENVKHLEFATDIADRVKVEALKLKAQGAELVILTIHEGGSCLVNQVKFLRKVEKICQGEIFKIADELIGSVNAIVAGHTHQKVYKLLERDGQELLILQPGSKGSEISFADIGLDGRVTAYDSKSVCSNFIMTKEIEINNEWVQSSGCGRFHLNVAGSDRVIDVTEVQLNGKKFAPDPRIVELLKKPISDSEKILSRKSGGAVLGEFNRNFKNENALGNLASDLLRSSTQAEIGLANNGGLRANLLAAGNVTYGQVYDIFPFDNEIVIMSVKGRTLRNMLSFMASSSNDEGYSWSGIATVESDCQVKSAQVTSRKGKPALEDNEIYTVATTDFLLSIFKSLSQIDQPHAVSRTGIKLRDMIFTAMNGLVMKPDQYFSETLKRAAIKNSCLK